MAGETFIFSSEELELELVEKVDGGGLKSGFVSMYDGGLLCRWLPIKAAGGYVLYFARMVKKI